MMQPTRWLAVAACISALVSAAPVRAEVSEANKSAAEALFDEGRRLMAAGQYAEACVKLADSNTLDPGVGTLLNLGQCYKSLGRTASAWSTYREAAALARSSGQSDRETLARSEASALEASLVRLVVQVPAEVAAAHPELRRDGTPMPPSLWGLPAPVDPGEHVIDATAPGKKPQRLEVSVTEPGSTGSVTIPAFVDEPVSQQHAAATTTASALAAPASEPPSSNRSGLRVTGFVVGGIGLAAAATGGVFMLLGKHENDEALKLCTGGSDASHCGNLTERQNHENHVETARKDFLIGYVGLGVGAAGLVSSVIMLAASGGQSSASQGDAPGKVAILPRVGPNALGFDVAGSF